MRTREQELGTQVIHLIQKNNALTRHISNMQSKIIETIKDGDVSRLHKIKAPDELTQEQEEIV